MAAACQSLEIGGKACGKRISRLALLCSAVEKKLVRYNTHTRAPLHTHTHKHTLSHTHAVLVGDVVSSKFVENFYQYAEAMT